VCIQLFYLLNQALVETYERSVSVFGMDALLHSNRVPELHEAAIISAMMDAERDSINTFDKRIHKLEQDAEISRQRVQRLAAELEAETRGLWLHEDMIMELHNTRDALQQSIERKQAVMSSRRRTPVDVWQMIFLLLWESEFQKRNEPRPPVAVGLQVGAVCREWRNIAQMTTKLWSILDYTFSSEEWVGSRRDYKLNHYLNHIGTATPYITLRRAPGFLLPAALCLVTTAKELTVIMNYADVPLGLSLTFPRSTAIFSHLSTLSISSDGNVLQVMSDFLFPFPHLKSLCLMNMEIHWVPDTVPHISLKTLYIGGKFKTFHPWRNVTIDIATVAELFPNLTLLTLDCNLRVSAPQVILHHVQGLFIRSNAINSINIHELTSRVSFPNLGSITNKSRSINGLLPIILAWGKRVEELGLSGLRHYDATARQFSEMPHAWGVLPRLTTLLFRNSIRNGMGMPDIDLALLADIIARRNSLTTNASGHPKRIETVRLPITHKSHRDLALLERHVAVEWE